MTDNREDALVEIYNRVKDNRTELGLTSFKRTPTAPISDSDMPCLLMLEGNDGIVSSSSKTNTGYPVRRVLEVTLELVTDGDTDIKSMLRDVRRVVFTQRDTDPPLYDAKLLPNNRTGSISENRMKGPDGYGLPNVLGMSLVLDLVYTDAIL